MTTAVHTVGQVWEWLQEVRDPEVPVISVVELGIVRDVLLEDGTCTVTITPTYSGCPAMQVITDNIRNVLQEQGLGQVNVVTQLSPAWTTDWMHAEGRRKLKEYGIAPPAERATDYQTIDISRLLRHRHSVLDVACPRCNSVHTRQTSRFGSTSCKALYVCDTCHEPFDYFKCH